MLAQRQADNRDRDEAAEQETGVFAQALVRDLLVRVGRGDDGHEEQGEAEAAAVVPAEALGDFFFGARGEGFVETFEGRVRTVVGADEGGEG